jgi:uncharacterized protein (UPF0335 family)
MWLQENIVTDTEVSVTVQREHLEDFISKIKEAELEYEEV